MRIRAAALLATLLFSACSTPESIIGADSAFRAADPSGNQAELPYELQSMRDLDVAVHVTYQRQGSIEGGYRANLYFANKGINPVTIEPRLAIVSPAGAYLPPASRDQFMSIAHSLASASPPPMPEDPYRRVAVSGTAWDSYGNSYSYTGTAGRRPSPSEQFATGYAQGAAIGDTIVAMASIAAGRDLIQWGEAYYLRPTYTISPGGKVFAVVYFPSTSPIGEDVALQIKPGPGRDLLEFK
jgi:hypothetical protein